MNRDDMIQRITELLGSLATRRDAELLFNHLRRTGGVTTCQTGYALDQSLDLLAEYARAAASSRPWLISSHAGSVFGVYRGATREEAFEAMVADAGATDAVDNEGNPTAGSVDDWFIDEIEPGNVVFDGRIVDMSAARELMDDDIAESIHGTVSDDQAFIDAYCRAHFARYGEPFRVN